MLYTYMPSPIGDLLLAGSTDALEIVGFPEGNKRLRAHDDWERDDQAFAEAITQLDHVLHHRCRQSDVGHRDVVRKAIGWQRLVYDRAVAEGRQAIEQ